jgi:hypothetical protein
MTSHAYNPERVLLEQDFSYWFKINLLLTNKVPLCINMAA